MRPGIDNNVHRRGVVLVITLLALVLMVALVLWVINLGQQVNHRLATQNAADASARAGAGWIARSMNTIANNNLNMARYLATINVLDSMPQAAEYALVEHTSFRDRLAEQLAAGLGGDPAILYTNLRHILSDLHNEMNGEIDDMTPVVEFFASFDVGVMTRYQSDGLLWQSLYALDETNQAMTESLGPSAQVSAISGGEANLPSKVDSAAMMLPFEPIIPVRRGRFVDFKQPVMQGLLPPDVDDKIVRRGPYDTVFGWRRIVGKWEGGTWVPGNSNNAGGASGKGIGITHGAVNSSGGRRVGGKFVPTNYRTYGPQSWLVQKVHNYARSHLRNTRLSWYVSKFADVKSRFVWPDAVDLSMESSYTMSGVFDPNWITSFPEALALANEDRSQIKETAFFVVEIKSKYDAGDPNFMSSGTWSLVARGSLRSPRLRIVRGWSNPISWGVEQTGQYVWRDDWQYRTYWDNQINIEPIRDENDNLVPQPVYRVDHVVFAGVNIGPNANVTNPYEGFSPDADGSPAPMELRHDQLPHDDYEARWQYLNYLGMARRSDLPQSWPSRFRGGRPSPNMVALAQAHVFNNHSWDLWTPMWRAELVPISKYDAWLERMDEQAVPPTVSSGEVQTMLQYLTNTRQLASTMLGH